MGFSFCAGGSKTHWAFLHDPWREIIVDLAKRKRRGKQGLVRVASGEVGNCFGKNRHERDRATSHWTLSTLHMLAQWNSACAYQPVLTVSRNTTNQTVELAWRGSLLLLTPPGVTLSFSLLKPFLCVLEQSSSQQLQVPCWIKTHAGRDCWHFPLKKEK